LPPERNSPVNLQRGYCEMRGMAGGSVREGQVAPRISDGDLAFRQIAGHWEGGGAPNDPLCVARSLRPASDRTEVAWLGHRQCWSTPSEIDNRDARRGGIRGCHPLAAGITAAISRIIVTENRQAATL
jgi:hypothetical protein